MLRTLLNFTHKLTVVLNHLKVTVSCASNTVEIRTGNYKQTSTRVVSDTGLEEKDSIAN